MKNFIKNPIFYFLPSLFIINNNHMKTIFLAIFIFISFSNKAQYNFIPETQFNFEFDTTKFEPSTKSNAFQKIQDAFKDVSFSSLILISDTSITCINAINKEKIQGVCLGPQEAIMGLQKVFTSFSFCCFRIFEKQMSSGTILIFVKTFVFEHNENYGMNAYFEINNGKIITIAIE